MYIFDQKMAKAYDQDLRDKVIAFIERGNKAPLASKIFGLASNTIRNWYKRYKEEGHFSARRNKGKPSRVEQSNFLKYVEENDDCTLLDIGFHFNMTASGAYYYMKKFGLRYKKKNQVTKKPVPKNVQNI